MRSIRLVILVALLATLLTTAWAETLPPAPAKHFHDQVGLVSGGDARRLTAALEGFEQRTGIQFVMAALPELQGDLADTAARIYEHWGLGNTDTHRGVLFLVYPRQGKSRIEVGYGLEENLPDVKASRILREMMQVPSDPAAARFELVMIRVA